MTTNDENKLSKVLSKLQCQICGKIQCNESPSINIRQILSEFESEARADERKKYGIILIPKDDKYDNK